MIKAEVVKWGAAPGDSNAERIVLDIYEIYRDQIDPMHLRSKGRIVTITVEENEQPSDISTGA